MQSIYNSLDPSKRITSRDALDHDFFSTDPLPVSAERTLRHLPDNCFEMTVPQGRKQAINHMQRPKETHGMGVSAGMGDRLY